MSGHEAAIRQVYLGGESDQAFGVFYREREILTGPQDNSFVRTLGEYAIRPGLTHVWSLLSAEAAGDIDLARGQWAGSDALRTMNGIGQFGLQPCKKQDGLFRNLYYCLS